MASLQIITWAVKLGLSPNDLVTPSALSLVLIPLLCLMHYSLWLAPQCYFLITDQLSLFHFSTFKVHRIYFYQPFQHLLSSFTSHHYLLQPFMCLIHHFPFWPSLSSSLVTLTLQFIFWLIAVYHPLLSFTFDSNIHQPLMSTVISWILTQHLQGLKYFCLLWAWADYRSHDF